MYERMLNKSITPTLEEMSQYCNKSKDLFLQLNEWITVNFYTSQEIVFPYGNSYGWGIAQRKGKKLLCNVFAEKDAFTVMIRLTNKQYKSVYNDLQESTKKVIDNYYPCNDGGWIHYRICNVLDYEDIKRIIKAK